MQKCYCGKKILFSLCCGAIHNAERKAETAEELMRSRYSAFATANGNFLRKSHSIKTIDRFKKEESVRWSKSVKWQKLEIIRTINGGKNDSTGIVEFRAHYKHNFLCYSIHERSIFLKENGKWYYLEGMQF